VWAQKIVDHVIIVDDASRDETATIARFLPQARLVVHDNNRGYGANQKTCYRLALEEGADMVIMVHPDYQYTPKLIPAMASLIASGLYHCVLGSRILGGYALKGGMPGGNMRQIEGLPSSKIYSWGQNFRNTIQDTVPFPGAYSRRSPGSRTRMILC